MLKPNCKSSNILCENNLKCRGLQTEAKEHVTQRVLGFQCDNFYVETLNSHNHKTLPLRAHNVSITHKFINDQPSQCKQCHLNNYRLHQQCSIDGK